MKIGIITVYDSPNFGSYLQAYALRKYLETMGHNVFWIKNKRNIILKRIIIPAIWTKNRGMQSLKAAKKKVFIYLKEHKEDKLVSDYQDMDLLIIGSDTLWDVARPFFRQKKFWGDLKFQKGIISYAVSCGNSEAEDFKALSNFTKKICDFDEILVRDKHTQEVIKDVFNIDVDTVCDPTLLVSREIWKFYPIDYDLSNVILIYAYSIDSIIKKYIQKYAKENKYKIASIGLYKKWCDFHINCLSLEFFSYLKSAKIIITNTFHGTICSILAEAKVITIKNGMKVDDLVKEIEVTDEIYISNQIDYDGFCKKAEQKIDYDKINKRISEIRDRSDSIFREILVKYDGDNL